MEQKAVVAQVCSRSGNAAGMLVCDKPLQRFKRELFSLAASHFACRNFSQFLEPVAKFRPLEKAALGDGERKLYFFLE